MKYRGYIIEEAYFEFIYYVEDDEESGCSMAHTIEEAKEYIDDEIAEKIEDIWSCCGDKLPDNNVCPTCKEHN